MAQPALPTASPHDDGAARHAPPLGTPRLLDRLDLVWMLAFMTVGLGLRLLNASGFGLADDNIFRGSIAQIQTGNLLWGNQTYRVTWWLPTLVSCRILGLNEVGLILPITATATLGIGLVYALGKAVSGRSAAIIAALLLVVQPLDFAWSTMLANDIVLSFVSGLAVLFVLRAIHHDGIWKYRFWMLAAVSLWAAFLEKVSAVVLIPTIATICWMHRERLGAAFADFLLCAGALLGTTTLVFWLFTNDPLAPYHSEVVQMPVSSVELWIYPRWLFMPTYWGAFVHSLYPPLLIVLALGSRWLRIRTSPEILWWLLFTFLGLQFAMRWDNGTLFTGFRNVRHAHVLVYPVIVALAGYLSGLHRRHPRAIVATLVALLAFSGWQSVTIASRTKAAFGDRRNACRYLASLPAKTIYADGGIQSWCMTIPDVAWKFQAVQSPDAAGRTTELAAVTSGYLVTGGGREPVYGPFAGTPIAAEVPTDRWTLLREFPAEILAPWRPEPLRVWEAIEPAAAPGGGAGGAQRAPQKAASG